MAWPERWRALSARIEGITRAGEYVVAALQRNDGDSLGIVRQWIAPELEKITIELRDFQNAARGELPPAAADALERFFRQDWFTKQPELINSNLVSVAAMTTFRAEFEYLTHDSEADGSNRTEVAFEHLQRMISVDGEAGRKWKEAYARNEAACERLGAVHLLSHGIYAFKVGIADSATDLVFNEPIDEHNRLSGGPRVRLF